MMVVELQQVSGALTDFVRSITVRVQPYLCAAPQPKTLLLHTSTHSLLSCVRL